MSLPEGLEVAGCGERFPPARIEYGRIGRLRPPAPRPVVNNKLHMRQEDKTAKISFLMQFADAAMLLAFAPVVLASGASAQPPSPPPLQQLQAHADKPVADIAVGEAALLLDQAIHPDVDIAHYRAMLQKLAQEAATGLGQVEGDAAKLEVLAKLIYGRWHFADSDALPPEVYVGFHEVLDQRQWNCFGMTVLYIALGEHLGIPLKMVSGRGHVFVALAREPALYVETTLQGKVFPSKNYLERYLPFPCLNPDEYRVLDAKQTVSVLLSQTALALQHQEQLSQALPCFQLAVKFDPQNAEAHTGLGFLELAQRNLMGAGEAFKRAIEAEPTFREAYGGLGTMLHAAGHTAAAASAYQKAVELCPEEPAAVFNLGQLLYEMGETDRALEWFERYVKLAPEDAEGFAALALAREDAGARAGAKTAYEQALKLNPKHVDANINLGYLLERQGQPAEAEGFYRAALKASAGNALALAGLGRIATQRQDYGAAGEAFEKALKADPDNASLHLDQGYLLRALGKHEEALAAFRKAMALDVSDPEAYTAAAETLRTLGRTAEADELMAKAPATQETQSVDAAAAPAGTAAR